MWMPPSAGGGMMPAYCHGGAHEGKEAVPRSTFEQSLFVLDGRALTQDAESISLHINLLLAYVRTKILIMHVLIFCCACTNH